jgi:heterotetrameric sarcosine oxidase gamma subunit
MVESLPQPVQKAGGPHNSSSERVQINAVAGRTALRLKSWLPEVTSGWKPVVLASQELPSEVGATLSGPMHVLCTAPGDWLIVSQVFTPSNLREYVVPDLSRHGLVLTDLTAGLTVLEVGGSAARDVLSKGCGLDMHVRSFPVGRCARTRFAQIPVLIDYVDPLIRFELYVSRSYTDYFRDWLADAAVEFEEGRRDVMPMG